MLNFEKSQLIGTRYKYCFIQIVTESMAAIILIIVLLTHELLHVSRMAIDHVSRLKGDMGSVHFAAYKTQLKRCIKALIRY